MKLNVEMTLYETFSLSITVKNPDLKKIQNLNYYNSGRKKKNKPKLSFFSKYMFDMNHITYRKNSYI